MGMGHVEMHIKWNTWSTGPCDKSKLKCFPTFTSDSIPIAFDNVEYEYYYEYIY